MKIGFIGDIHGEFNTYFSILEMLKDCDITLQLGDMGLGFDYTLDKQYQEGIKKYPNARFLKGNHDNPLVCRNQPSYLGDFGVFKDKIFFISGAWSIDYNCRTIGRDWWPEEELSIKQCNEVIKLYEKTLPDVIISHECADSVRDLVVMPLGINSTKTGLLLDELINLHQPSLHIFCHYHVPKDFNYLGTRFRCLNINETFSIQLNDFKGVTENE